MSIAEFYIDYGINPSDPNHMNDFLRGARDELLDRDSSSRTPASSWTLNESELDYMAETRGWDKIEGLPAQPPMASYRKEGVRLNFWLSTGTVGSYLDHARQGKTQLFRREITMEMASNIFSNPRQHTGKGYHDTKNASGSSSSNNRRKRKADSPAIYLRTCASCGKSKPNSEYSNN